MSDYSVHICVSTDSPASDFNEIEFNFTQDQLFDSEKSSQTISSQLVSQELELKTGYGSIVGPASSDLMHSTFCDSLNSSQSIARGSSPPRNNELDDDEELQEFPELEGHYKVIKMIGEGTFSRVFKAVKIDDGAEVAVKRIHPTCSAIRILRELETLHLLSGKNNIIKFIGWVQCKSNISMIFQYCSHLAFNEYYLDMDEEDVKLYMKALFTALGNLHLHNLIHRDVKPNNFLCTYRKYPKTSPKPTFEYYLIDFGLAQKEQDAQKLLKRQKKKEEVKPKQVVNRTLSKQINNNNDNNNNNINNNNNVNNNNSTTNNKKRKLPDPSIPDEKWEPTIEIEGEQLFTQRVMRSGTRGFRAPEVLLRSTKQTTKTDVWSAGVIFLSFLSSRYPFFHDGDDTTSLLEIMAVIGQKEVADAARTSMGKTLYLGFPEYQKYQLSDLCKKLGGKIFSKEAYDLLAKCLDPNPDTRITAKLALCHPFFQIQEDIII